MGMLMHSKLAVCLAAAALHAQPIDRCDPRASACTNFTDTFFTGVAAADPATLVAIGMNRDEENVFKRSTDGGRTWKDVAVPESVPKRRSSYRRFQDVRFVDGSKGFAVGDSGLFLTTTDGGASWVSSAKEGTICFAKIDFQGPFAGYVLGTDAQGSILLHTTDAGSTWNSRTVPGVHFTSIDFLDAKTGFATSYLGFYHTVDGGANWDSIPWQRWSPYPSSIEPHRLYDLAFLGPGDGIIVGAGPMAVLLDPSTGNYPVTPPPLGYDTRTAYRTSIWDPAYGIALAGDGGKLYTRKPADIGWTDLTRTSADLFDLEMPSPGVFVAVGNEIILRVEDPGVGVRRVPKVRGRTFPRWSWDRFRDLLGRSLPLLTRSSTMRQ